MTVIAVVNRKGGSGKSMLAAHVAAYLASQGDSVMLGDVDRQQSSRLWLKMRPATRNRINGWTIDERNFTRPPAGTRHVVLDTPGGFQGLPLMKVALYADAILIPASTSAFDRASAAETVAELRSLPRVASGKCQLACVGMRIDGRTHNAEILADWATAMALPYLGAIRAAQAYCRCLEQGLSLFDMPSEKVGSYLADWQTLTHWLDGMLRFVAPEPRIERPVDAARPVSGAAPEFLRRQGTLG